MKFIRQTKMELGDNTEIEEETTTFNGENFSKSSYNEVSVLKRDKDNYDNGSALCEADRKEIKELFKTQQWQEDIVVFKKHCSEVPYYLLPTTYPNELRGFYIHPDLIHSVIMYCSADYRYKVRILMNLINERNKLLNLKLVDNIEAMKKEIAQIKEEHKTQIANLNQKNINLKTRAVPNNYQYRYSYLIFQDGNDENGTRTFKLVRRLAKDVRVHPIYRNIIRNELYFYYIKNLPNCMSINRKVLRIVDYQIPESKFVPKKQLLIIPIDKIGKFKDIIDEVIQEDH
jgi:hypothetical protein